MKVTRHNVMLYLGILALLLFVLRYFIPVSIPAYLDWVFIGVVILMSAFAIKDQLSDSPTPIRSIELTPEQCDEVKLLKESHNTLGAIKLVRSYDETNLASAKHYVDNL